MKSKILSILLLLVVVTAFSGVASAASHQVLVKEAYDEQVLVTPAYNESVLVTAEIPAWDELISEGQAAWNESTFNHWLVSGSYTVHHPAVLVSEEIPAYDEQVLVSEAYDEEVLVSEAYDEQVLVSEAYDEEVLVTPAHTELVQQKWFNGWKEANNYANARIQSGHADSAEIYWAWNGCKYQVLVNLYDEVPAVFETIHHDAEYETVHHDAVYETVHHDAVFETVHHDAIPAVYTPAYNEEVPYTGNGPYFGGSPSTGLDQNDVSAWAAWIYTHEGATGGWGSWTPYYSLIEHPTVDPVYVHHDAVPAVYEIIEHPAVFETIHHDAVFETVEDPIIPVVTPEVKDPVVTPVSGETIPMQDTGANALPIVGAALAILGGFIIAAYRRRDDEDEE